MRIVAWQVPPEEGVASVAVTSARILAEGPKKWSGARLGQHREVDTISGPATRHIKRYGDRPRSIHDGKRNREAVLPKICCRTNFEDRHKATIAPLVVKVCCREATGADTVPAPPRTSAPHPLKFRSSMNALSFDSGGPQTPRIKG